MRVVVLGRVASAAVVVAAPPAALRLASARWVSAAKPSPVYGIIYWATSAAECPNKYLSNEG
eukprot:scaffold46519_cov63-Phaeocystis_antarctica.AAC.3